MSRPLINGRKRELYREAAAPPWHSPITAPKTRENDVVLVCVRVPKSGSASLTAMLRQAFADRQIFHLPNTLPGDGAFSAFQRYRAARSRLQALWKHYRTLSQQEACARIAALARPGDLIEGGHIDFPFVHQRLGRPVRLITILREPAARVLSEYNYARQSYFGKPLWARHDCGVLPKIAARHSFDGYLDFLAEHRHLYGDIAARYLGWDGEAPLTGFFAQHVFHAGVLERPEAFVHSLALKLGRPVRLPHTNRTFRRTVAELSPSQRGKVEDLYGRDYQLHDWVRRHG